MLIKLFTRGAGVISLLVWCVACSTVERSLCEEPRPQICTMDYRPVCAANQDGEQKTYGNACSACGDSDVISHRQGECS